MKTLKKTLLLVIALVAGVFGWAQTIEADFTQIRNIATSGKTIEKAGHMKLVYPDQLDMNYSKPDSEYFIIHGNEMSMNMDGKKNKVDTDKNKRTQTFAQTLLNCIKGDWENAAADNDTDTAVKEEGGKKIVTLTAKKKAPRGYAKIELTYNKADGMLSKMVLEEFGGVTNTYVMSNVTKK